MSKQSTITAEHIDQLKNIAKAKGFLGKEFLIWLWYRIDADKGNFRLKMNEESATQTSGMIQATVSLRAWIDDRVVLESVTAEAHTHTLKGGDPAHSLEAAASLRSGKLVKEIKLGLEIDGYGPFTAILGSSNSGNGLAPRSVNLPKELPEGSDETEPLALRLHLFQRFCSAIDALFALFLKERLRSDWEKSELQNLRTWINARKLETQGSLH